MLETYQDFLNRVNELGFMVLRGHNLLPGLEAETLPDRWHTGERETDPWQWKDRAAQEKELAFGCIVGGMKGFVAKKLYPLFYTANRPEGEPADSYEAGELSHTAWELYRLFENGAVLSTADLHKSCRGTGKGGAAHIDTALKELQKKYLLTVCGNKKKIALNGLEYGWPAVTYCRVEDWADSGWLSCAQEISRQDARNQILDSVAATAKNTNRATLSKLLFGKGKG